MAEDAPNLEFSDAERERLLGKLDETLGGKTVSREVWAFLWLADAEALQKLVADAEGGNSFYVFVALDSGVKKAEIVKKWMQKTRSRANSVPSTPASGSRSVVQPMTPVLPAPSETQPSTPPSAGRKQSDEQDVRSKTAAELCRERDNSQCVVTKSGPPVDAAHIFPFAMRKLQGTVALENAYNPWVMLKMFFKQERVDSWYHAVAGPGTETVQNHFCMTASAHKYHERGHFALRPIRVEGEEQQLPLEFWWLPAADSTSDVRISARPSLQCSRDCRADDFGRVVKLFDVRTDRKICCGDQITMETVDPERLPLPDATLLDMQWVLQRVVALCGGAEPAELGCNDEDDDDSSDGLWWGSDEDEDISDCSLTEPVTVPSADKIDTAIRRAQLLDDARLRDETH